MSPRHPADGARDIPADTPPVHDGVGAFAERYEAFILDLWGVLHDGVRAYPGAVDALKHLKAAGKRLLVLSNAPRQTWSIAGRMTELGLTDDLYDVLLSSGEDVWRHLRDRPCPWYRGLGRRLLHLGPERDRVMLQEIDFDEVADVEAADVILDTGPPVDGQDVAELRPLLQRAAARGLPMICANPDLTVMRGDRSQACAGAVAALFEELGGHVRYHGKPYPAIYASCFELLGRPARARTVAIGDSLRTDIAGARGAGLDAVLVTSGIHADELGAAGGAPADPQRLAALCAAEGHVPSAVIPAFRW